MLGWERNQTQFLRYDPDLLHAAKLVSINLYFVFQKVCNRKPILTINASHLRSIACFVAQEKSLCSPLANRVTFSAIINALQGVFFHINLKLYIWEIPVQRQSMLCFSVWPFAITRMCKYNLAQVKFNQSPQAQRNLHLPEKKTQRVFPCKWHRGAVRVSKTNLLEYLNSSCNGKFSSIGEVAAR